MNVMKKLVIATVAACMSLVSVVSNAQDITITNASPATYYFPAHTNGSQYTNTYSTATPTSYTSPATNSIVMSSGTAISGEMAQFNPSSSNFSSSNFSVAPSSPTVQGLIAKAKTLIGLPYRFGGTSPVSGFDCSGFMQYIYKHTANVDLPRRSEDMASVGQRISREALKAGDMVFFKTHGSAISHVGMYIGENRFIHAPRTGKSIEITSLGNSYWTKTYATARRVLADNNA